MRTVYLVLAALACIAAVAGRADKEQRAEIERLLGNGQFGTAVNQVRLWFRGTSHERATEIVQQLT